MEEKEGKLLLQKIRDYQDELLYFVGFLILYFFFATASYERNTKVTRLGNKKNIMDFSFRDIIDVFILDLWPLFLCFIVMYGVIFKLSTEDSIHQKEKGYIGSIVDKFLGGIGILTIVVTVIIIIAVLPEIWHYSPPTIYDGFQVLVICSSLLTIVIVLFALDRNKSKIEAAGEAWLILTVLGAIVAIILSLMIF